MQITEVSAPKNLNEALSFYKRFPNVVPASGCTGLMLDHSNKPTIIISLHGIEELQTITRTDRFIEFGSSVSLSRILSIPNSKQILPLQKAIETIGTFSTRNLSTIGGNLFVNGTGTLFPILALLDASCELRSFNAIKIVKIYDLIKSSDTVTLPENYLLTKIKIPLDYSMPVFLFRKNKVNCYPNRDTVLLALTADFSRTSCSNMRIMLHDGRCIRARSVELFLIGKDFPISNEEIETVITLFTDILDEYQFTLSQKYFLLENLINFLVSLPGD